MLKFHLRKSYLDNIIFTYLFFVVFAFNESEEYVWLIYIGFFLVAVLSLFQIINHHGKIRVPSISLLLVLFYVWCLIGVFSNLDYVSAIVNRLVTLILLFAVILLLYNYLHYTQNLDSILVCMNVAGAIFAVYVIFSEGGLSSYVYALLAGQRVGSNAANVNYVGLNLCFSYAAGCYYFCKSKRQFIFIPLILIFCVAASTGSRKVMLFFVSFTALFVYYYIQITTEKHSISRLGKFCCSVLIAIAAVLLLASTGIFDTTIERFSAMFGVSDSGKIHDGSANTRANMIKIGLHGFAEKPIWGYGLNGSGILTQRYLGWTTYLHNNYVEILATTGIGGFILYYGFFAYLLIKMFLRLKERSLTVVFGFCTLLTQLVIEIAVVSYYSKRLAILIAIWMFIALQPDSRESLVTRNDVESSNTTETSKEISD